MAAAQGGVGEWRLYLAAEACRVMIEAPTMFVGR